MVAGGIMEDSRWGILFSVQSRGPTASYTATSFIVLQYFANAI